MTRIVKTTYVFDILHPEDVGPFASLEDALAEANDGHAVGNVSSEVTTDVAPSRVPGELRRLGNDGTFFDVELGKEEL